MGLHFTLTHTKEHKPGTTYNDDRGGSPLDNEGYTKHQPLNEVVQQCNQNHDEPKRPANQIDFGELEHGQVFECELRVEAVNSQRLQSAAHRIFFTRYGLFKNCYYLMLQMFFHFNILVYCEFTIVLP